MRPRRRAWTGTTSWLLAGALVLVVPGIARAHIYLVRDPRTGAIHITNAPAAPTQGIMVRELPRPMRLNVVKPGPTGKPTPTAFDPLIRRVADAYGVEYALVKAVIKAESGFNHRAVSPKGAQGLMQLMPATAAQHQVRDVFVPRDNVEGGVQHLRWLLDRYGGKVDLAVAAYNAGHQRVEEAGGIPNIAETKEYVARVLRYRTGYLREKRNGPTFVYAASR